MIENPQMLESVADTATLREVIAVGCQHLTDAIAMLPREYDVCWSGPAFDAFASELRSLVAMLNSITDQLQALRLIDEPPGSESTDHHSDGTSATTASSVGGTWGGVNWGGMPGVWLV